jgi:glutaredoxin
MKERNQWSRYANRINQPNMKPCLTLLALFLAFPAFAGVYKWTDAQGNVHYSDSPPPAARTTQLKLQTYTGPAQVSRAIGADSGVTLYTTEWCGVCKRAKAFMKQNGVPFREWDVEKTDYGATKFRQLGGSGVPLITVGSEKMMGFDADRFMALWKNQKGQAE